MKQLLLLCCIIPLFSGIELGPCPTSSDRLPCSPDYPEMVRILRRIASSSDGAVTLHSAGQSQQNRTIWYARAGSGPKKYYSWGRIHGNECVGTAAILKVLRKLTDGSHLSRFTLNQMTAILIPIANPDGSEAGTRESAPISGWPNGRDLNRDWCTRGQNEQPSPCIGNTVPDSITGLPVGGCSNSVCSCPPDATQFITKEVNALWDLLLREKPDIVADIHQFGSAFVEGTQILSAGQVVIPRHGSVFSEKIVFQNLQTIQVLYDSFQTSGQIATRWNFSFVPGLPGRSSSARIAEGKRNINDTRFTTSAVGIEFRRVCPVYERNLEELAFRVLLDQLVATATHKIFNINPKRAVEAPFGVLFSCTTPCPSVLPEEHVIDHESWEEEWLDREISEAWS